MAQAPTGPAEAPATVPEIDARGLTWWELDELYPELERRELHDGVLMMAPMPTWWHQEVAGRLYIALHAWTSEHGGRVMLPVDVVASERRVYQPDVWLLLPENVHRLTYETGKLHAPADLVVEVSSPSTRAFDLRAKRDAYATFGIPEYWFVDTRAGAVALHRLEGDSYPAPTVLSTKQQLTSPQLPGFEVSVAELLRDIPHK